VSGRDPMNRVGWRRSRAFLGTWVMAAMAVAAPQGAAAQDVPPLRIRGPGDQVRSVVTAEHRGYHAVPASALIGLGWSLESRDGEWLVRHPSGTTLRLVEGSPFFHWNDDLRQLVGAPYVFGEDVYIPVQLLLDYFPARLPEAYTLTGAAGEEPTLRVLDPAHWSGSSPGAATAPRAEAVAPSPVEPPPGATQRAPGAEVPRVVIIDAGHGGRDPGTTGASGTREKDVALAVARALARELEGVPGLEVHLTRDTDLLVPIWRRGQWATDRKGERPGIFISLHANALPGQPSVRGYETYFLSEARTDHERRVVANENAPLAIDREDGTDVDDPGLDFILKELRNLDHQHWSALFAELVQEELRGVHPGPDRGVKQGSLAVITNSLMPSVLIEMGFLSNRDEERLLNRETFQEDVARAVASAVSRFFRRYPPGQAGAVGRDPAGRVVR